MDQLESDMQFKDYSIYVDKNGNWFHEGGRIGRMPLVKLFASVLKREDDGTYWLVTPAEREQIGVEDLPFLVTGYKGVPGEDYEITLITNLDDEVPLGRDHMFQVDKDSDIPRVKVRDGLYARLNRSVFFDFADAAEEEKEGFKGFTAGGVFHPVGKVV